MIAFARQLSPERVRALTRDCKRYGSLKRAVANLPPDGVLLASERIVENWRSTARRLGVKITVRRVGNGPSRLVLPALSGAELSRLSSEL